MNVIVTIPAYNEEKTIVNVIKSVREVMDKTEHKYKIIVVDDGSKDKTVEVSRKAGSIVFSHPYNCGLSETFRTEIKKCLELKADVIVHIDADGQYRASEIPNLLQPIIKGEADLVLGSRFSGTIEQMPFLKKLGNKWFSKVITGITGVKITDGQTGFRAFTRELAEKINIISNHTYTQEQIIKSVKEKFRIKEVPIYFAKRSDGKSRLISNPFEYALKAWINIIRIYRDYAPLKFFGRIGTFFITLSTLIAVYVSYLFLFEGSLGTFQKLPTILLAILLFITGVQIILFGFLADEIKK